MEKEMATHSSILAWSIPMDRGAWQAKGHGVGEKKKKGVKPQEPKKDGKKNVQDRKQMSSGNHLNRS